MDLYVLSSSKDFQWYFKIHPQRNFSWETEAQALVFVLDLHRYGEMRRCMRPLWCGDEINSETLLLSKARGVTFRKLLCLASCPLNKHVPTHLLKWKGCLCTRWKMLHLVSLYFQHATQQDRDWEGKMKPKVPLWSIIYLWGWWVVLWIKTLVSQIWCEIFRTLKKGEGMNQLHYLVLWPPHPYCDACMPPHTHNTYTQW